jgi:glutamate 5-kinase
MKQYSQSEINQLVLRMKSFNTDAPISKLQLIKDHDGGYVENPRTPEDVSLFEHFHKPEPVLTGYCTECQRTINYGGIHDFICSTAKKCVECGQRTDLGLYTAHDDKCSQYVEN